MSVFDKKRDGCLGCIHQNKKETQMPCKKCKNAYTSKWEEIPKPTCAGLKKMCEYLEKWLEGEKVKGFQMSLLDIDDCVYVYNGILIGERPAFMNEKVKQVLDKCKIKVEDYDGVGWRVAEVGGAK